jgi:hypothetical protein
MTKIRTAAITALTLLLAGPAMAGSFKVGDRVHVGSTNEDGTVIAVGQVLTDGGTFIKVHLDRFGAAYPDVGVTYDTTVAKVTVTGGAVPAAPVQVAPKPATAPQLKPQPAQIDPTTQTQASQALCQQLIRANYPGGGDVTITVNFLSFQMSAARPYEAIYANDMVGARGHTVTATPVHAKFTVLTHYADPRADDQLRTYDAQYMCYKSPKTGWTVEETSRVPGGETAQYIHKN